MLTPSVLFAKKLLAKFVRKPAQAMLFFFVLRNIFHSTEYERLVGIDKPLKPVRAAM